MSVTDTPRPEPDKLPSDKPLKAVIDRPMQRPGETKEEAARRLARELFGKLKPSEPTAERPPTPHPE